MSRQMDLLSTIQELQMVDALVQLHKWPRATADYVVRRVSHGVHATTHVPWGPLDDLLQKLRYQKIITAGQLIQVRNYLISLNDNRELRRDLLRTEYQPPKEPTDSFPYSEPEYATGNPYFVATDS